MSYNLIDVTHVDLLGYINRQRKADDSYHTFATYEHRRTCINHLFESQKFELSKDFLVGMKLGMAGLRRTIALHNDKEGNNVKTGKDSMSSKCYKFLCTIYTEEANDPKNIFAHAYLVMTWNLMCHVESTSHIHLKHIFAVDDHLEFFMARHKGDQYGLTENNSRHIYANAKYPLIEY